MANEEAMIKLRIDVDYPYPSRAKSFLYLALGIKKRKSKDYLKNARVIAKMINESPKEVMAYWFFTPYTIPDKKLLDLLNPDRHEVALHVANDPYREWKILENETNRTVKYYTIHGTSRLLAQLLWGRKIGQKQAKVPSDFPLTSFQENVIPTKSLDFRSYSPRALDVVKKEAEEFINQNYVLSIHPEWLFKKEKKNRRGPFYRVLKSILEVDKDLETLRIRKKVFFKIAHDIKEYEKNIVSTDEFIEKLGERDIDIFTFLDRKWCCPIPNPPSTWIKSEDNVGLLEIKDYDAWWSDIGKKTRNMVRRAEKSGINVAVIQPNEKFAEGIWKIYNETPIRQERAFPHYGEPLQTVTGNMFKAQNSTFIGAFLQEELVGFIQITYGDSIAIISQILSMQKHWDKAVNNALLAKAVEVCASKGERWLMYGRIGNHPSLDRFKESNGFVKFPITRYYVPITWKGKVAIRLGLHREFKDALPQPLKGPLIPVFNWASRNKMRFKHGLVKQVKS
ncbi:MAG: GNAT family N-acetyltransferase [Candidatus Bathyarchaeia archaeon]